MAGKMKEILENAALCSVVGEFQPDFTCKCTDPAAAGPACEFSNAKTCSGAGVVDAAGQCNCTDPAVGVGSSCEYSNAKTCSDAGIAQSDGSCVCTDPAVGTGPTCVEHTNAKTCSDAGIAQADGSCVCADPAVGTGPTCVEHTNAKTCSDAGIAQADGSCVCADPAVGVGPSCEYNNAKTCSGVGTTDASGQCTCDGPATGLGPTCSEFSNTKNCNNQTTVNPDGTCPNDKPCNTNGYNGARCDECFTDTHVLLETDNFVDRITQCADVTDQSTCDEPTAVPLVTCELKGNTAKCNPGERSEAGECTPCEANTYADGNRTGGSDDGGFRVVCKPCPLGAITNQRGSSSLDQCIAQCNLGEYSSNSVCTACSTFGDNAFADGTDTLGASDNGRRTSCKVCPEGSSNQLERSTTINECVCANSAADSLYTFLDVAGTRNCTQCPPGEISEQGATRITQCFAKFQVVDDKLFCYGNSTDSRSSQAVAFADELIFVLSRVIGTAVTDASAVCEEAMGLAALGNEAVFIPTGDMACPIAQDKATPQACAEMASKSGGSQAFCNLGYPIPIGTKSGWPKFLCRDYECKDYGGTCWDPTDRADRGNPPYPIGCVYDPLKKKVLHYTVPQALQFYDGFAYQPLCERYICPPNANNDIERPVALTEAEILQDTTRIPECRLSQRGIQEYLDEATKENNTIFIPIAFGLTWLAMMGAYFYLGKPALVVRGPELRCGASLSPECKWILFGVGMRAFDCMTDWGFYIINMREKGFETTYMDKLLAGDASVGKVFTASLLRFQTASLVVCIVGLLLTPLDVWGNRQRTLGKHSLAMTISILILLLEDVPQLLFNIKFMFAMGSPDTVSALSLAASIGNIVYNVGLILYEVCIGEKPGLPAFISYCKGNLQRGNRHYVHDEIELEEMNRNTMDMQANPLHAARAAIAEKDEQLARQKLQTAAEVTAKNQQRFIAIEALSENERLKVELAEMKRKEANRKEKMKVVAKCNIQSNHFRFAVSDVGKPCIVTGVGSGVIRFVGLQAENNEPTVGVEMNKPKGIHNGTVKRHIYFKCEDGYGLLTHPLQVQKRKLHAGATGKHIRADEYLDVEGADNNHRHGSHA